MLKGRNAVITGASQGLGAAIAERFVQEGASVLICARSEAALAETTRKLREMADEGQHVLATVCDVADETSVDSMIGQALAQLGHVDILVNNAGVYGPMGPIEEVDWQEWKDAMTINVMGTIYPCRVLVPHMKDRGYGKIINLSGGGATNPLPRISAYAASKAAVVRFSETLAEELRGLGIDVNAVAPGALNTRLMDQLLDAGPEKVGKAFYDRMKKVSESGTTPLEVGASLCAYLASAASDGITAKLISAAWDPWAELQEHRADLDQSDIYTLRRIVPKDRGKTWGN
jgi:NAD(P)-dependent dehydrogenase (short-subunit alcohol dehydrogenase family)